MKKTRIIILALLILCLSTTELSTFNKGTLIVNFGFSAKIFEEVYINDAKVAIRIWAENLISKELQNQKRDFKVNVFVYQDLEQMIIDINKDNIDIITLSSLDYLKIRNTQNITPLALAMQSNSKYETKILLVKSNSGINDIKDLNNKNICYAKGGFSDVARLWINKTLLKDKKYKLNVVEYENTSKALLSVYLGNIDACIVDKRNYEAMYEMNPKLKSDLKNILESDPFPLGVTIIRKDFKEFSKEELLKFSLNMSNDAQGKQILRIFKISGLIPFENNALKGLEKMLNDNNK